MLTTSLEIQNTEITRREYDTFCFGYTEFDEPRGYLDRGLSKPLDVWVWNSGKKSKLKIGI